MPIKFHFTNIFHSKYQCMIDKKEKRYSKEFGKRIKELRKECEMSQSDLGGKAELEKTSIQRIERGYNPTLKTIKKLADGLNVSMSKLFDF